MKKNSKKLFLNNTAIETRRTTSKTAGGGLANYAIELGQWIENRIKDNTIKVGEQHVVDDIATRDDLFDVTKGDVAYVVDASADANVGSGAALYVYDGSDWKRIAKFESLNVTSSNITEGTLNPATTDRTVDMGTFDLDVTGTGHKKISFTNGSVTNRLHINPFSSYLGSASTGSDVYVATLDSELIINANSNASINLYKSTGNLHLYSYSGNYKLGATPTSTPKDLDSLTTPVYGLQINSSTGDITKVNKDAQFLADSQINPAISGHPTNAEIMTFLTSLTTSVRAGNLGRFFYYTGTDSPVNDYTHAYYLSADEKLFCLDKPTPEEIGDLTNVDASSSFDAYVLAYNQTSSTWVANRPPLLFSINVQKGTTPLTSADNGIQSDLVTFDTTREITNIKLSQYAALSSGSYDIAFKTLSGTTIASYSVADASIASTYGISGTAYTNFSIGGVYIEITNITGTLHGVKLNFDAIIV